MANYNKSFNFRNGIQVDNDNFVVNANGLVGIGTTIPKNYILNVQGDVSVSGLITASNLTIEDITADNLNTENVSASSSITAATFYGSAAGLTGIAAVAVDGWYITGGNISTTSNVGIGTDLPSGDLQVGIGVTINGDGNATYVGVITANSFNGSGSNITNINASNISSGTLSNSRLPSNINVSGVVTAYAFSGFGTNLTNINASNISSGTLSNSRLPSNVNLSGVVTAYAFSGFGTNLTNINASNISSGTLSNSRLPSNINVSGVVTASNFDGIASTAQSITGSPNITVTNITASNSNVSGISTVFTTKHVGSGGTAFAALNSGRIGVGTALPTSEIQVRKSNETLIEVISDTSQARISIGQSVGVGKSTAVLRFGSTPKNFDILNNDTGNINMYLHAGSSGIDTGRFAWLYGQSNTELASLTYTGNFGIGVTNPTSNLHVLGTSLVTGNATFESNVTITGNLTAGTINLPSLLNNTNINNVSGVSTFYGLNVTNNFTVAAGSSIGIATATPIVDLDARGKTGLFGSLGIGTASSNQTLKVTGSTLLQSVAIGNTSVDDGSGVGIFGGTTTLKSNSVSGINSTVVVLDSTCAIGVGTTSYRAAVDLSGAGKNHFGGIGAYMIVPILNSTEIAGITTFEGALIFNTTTKTFQGYTGTAWVDFH